MPRKKRSADELDQAFEELERETPDFLTRFILWMRTPEARKVRIPLGVVCILASFFWFLPIIGIELLPIGLLLLAQDIPPLRRPVGHMTLWLLRQWRHLRRWLTKRVAAFRH